MMMEKAHKITSLKFTDDSIVINIDGKRLEFLLAKISTKFANANKSELLNYRISPAGYGIHWNSLDEDISINGLLKIAKHSSAETVEN